MDKQLNSTDWEKQQWQAEQATRDAAYEKQREKWEKSRQRAARRAQRKLEKLKLTLANAGELSEWEQDFAESVSERLAQYGAAFHNPEKGRPGEALSFAQKKVIAALKKKSRPENKMKQDKKIKQEIKTDVGSAYQFAEAQKDYQNDAPQSSNPKAVPIFADVRDAPNVVGKPSASRAQRPFLRLVENSSLHMPLKKHL